MQPNIYSKLKDIGEMSVWKPQIIYDWKFQPNRTVAE